MYELILPCWCYLEGRAAVLGLMRALGFAFSKILEPRDGAASIHLDHLRSFLWQQKQRTSRAISGIPRRGMLLAMRLRLRLRLVGQMVLALLEV